MRVDSGGDGNGEEQSFISGCRFSGCFFCQGKVFVRDGRAVRIETNPDDPRGRRPCLRGRCIIQRTYNPDRLKYPMKRVGERGSGEWEQITWDEAISTIIEKWKGYMADFGPASVAIQSGSTTVSGYANGVGGVGIGTRLQNTLGWTTIAACADYALPKGINKVFGPASNVYGWPAFEPRNVVQSKTYIAWSANKTVASLQDWWTIMQAKESGTKLVVVDPVFTTIASKADLWVHPRPGSDTALVLSMIQVIVSEGWQDEEFILQHTVAPLLVREDTKQFLRLSDIGIKPTEGAPDMYGQPTLIDPYATWDLESQTATAIDTAIQPAINGTRTINGIKVTTAWDMLMEEINKYPPETATEICDVPPEIIYELARISALEKPVDHMVTYGSQAYDNGVSLGHSMATLVAITGNIGKPGAGLGANSFPFPFNYAYLFPSGNMGPSVPSYALYDILATGKFLGEDFPIKSVYLAGCGFVSGSTDMNRVISEIIEKLEFIVVADIAFTDTVRYADIILPAAYYLECEEMVGGMFSDPFILYDDKVVDPLFECKPDGEIIRIFGKELGVGEFFEKTNDELFAEVLDNDELRALGITPNTVKEKHAIRSTPEYTVANPECIYPTDTTRLEFYVANPTPRTNYGQTFDVEFERLPRWRPPKEAWQELEIMQEFPFVLISERPRDRFHSVGFQDTFLLELEPEPSFKINPADAQTHGIKEGDYVEVYNNRGHAVAVAHMSNGLRPGTLLYPKGWQINQFKAGAWSELTSSDIDPVGVNASFFDTAVAIRKWNEV
jgi:molybdopterin-containing oxidoreductase family molybdopterin binding subunit